MPIEREKIGSSFLIVPNTEHFFGDVRNNENYLEVMATLTFKDIAEVRLIRIGAISVSFSDSGPLRSIDKLKLTGSETSVPEEVM